MIPKPSPHCPAIFCVDLVLARILPFYPEKNGLCHKHLYKLWVINLLYCLFNAIANMLMVLNWSKYYIRV